jgi:double-GTPase-like protein
MWLKNRDTASILRLGFPDLSGEAFRSQWTERQLSVEYDERLREAVGGLLFVHPDNIVKPRRIDLLDDVLENLGTDEPTKKQKVRDTAWDNQKSPTQVQLVDILQFMATREYFHRPFRLAIVVSAWDRITPSTRRPDDWIATELPLLKQFFESNDELFGVSFFGVSAQGAQYALPHFWVGTFKDSRPFAKRLCEQGDPISAWIWSKLDASSHTTLDLLKDGKKPAESQVKELARDFNTQMALPDIYDEVRFEGVKLRAETERLLDRVSQWENERIYLGRFLLEDAYPELSREREYAKEASALKGKLPASRVLVVGESVRMQHDVTEPLQWLMR